MLATAPSRRRKQPEGGRGATSRPSKRRVSTSNTPSVPLEEREGSSDNASCDETPRKEVLQCPYCSHRLKASGDMKRHIREVHKNAKPYLCSICRGRFTRSSSVRQHWKGQKGKRCKQQNAIIELASEMGASSTVPGRSEQQSQETESLPTTVPVEANAASSTRVARSASVRRPHAQGSQAMARQFEQQQQEISELKEENQQLLKKQEQSEQKLQRLEEKLDKDNAARQEERERLMELVELMKADSRLTGWSPTAQWPVPDAGRSMLTPAATVVSFPAGPTTEQRVQTDQFQYLEAPTEPYPQDAADIPSGGGPPDASPITAMAETVPEDDGGSRDAEQEPQDLDWDLGFSEFVDLDPPPFSSGVEPPTGHRQQILRGIGAQSAVEYPADLPPDTIAQDPFAVAGSKRSGSGRGGQLGRETDQQASMVIRPR